MGYKQNPERKKLFMTGNEVMRLAGFTNRASFRSWQMQHRLKHDHLAGSREYYLRSTVERLLGLVA